VSDFVSKPCTAFDGQRMLSSGPLGEVAMAVKRAGDRGANGPVLVFDDATGAVVDLDLRGTKAEIMERLTQRGVAGASAAVPAADGGDGGPRARGRPKLGVVPREVTLLPRHWEWLAAQPGGASVVLRRLVEEARRGDAGPGEARARREAAYKFMSAVAGDLAGFEEATRALFAGRHDAFKSARCAGRLDDVRLDEPSQIENYRARPSRRLSSSWPEWPTGQARAAPESTTSRRNNTEPRRLRTPGRTQRR
jgi:hypothetical protein